MLTWQGLPRSGTRLDALVTPRRPPRLQDLCGVAAPRSVGSTPAPLRRAEFGVVTGLAARRAGGRLVRRIVPILASGLAGEHRVRRPRRPVVATLEDARRLHTDEHAAMSGREARNLGHLAAILVREPLARLRPRLAEVGAAPDRRAVPFARGGGVDRARPVWLKNARVMNLCPRAVRRDRGAYASAPAVETLMRLIVFVGRSYTKTSCAPFVS